MQARFINDKFDQTGSGENSSCVFAGVHDVQGSYPVSIVEAVENRQYKMK